MPKAEDISPERAKKLEEESIEENMKILKALADQDRRPIHPSSKKK